MPKILAALVLFLIVAFQATPALASCRSHTYMMHGRMIMCMTCCYGSMCNTTCN